MITALRPRGRYLIRLLCALALVVTASITIGCADPERVPILVRQLSSPESSKRAKAALELGRIGAPHANVAVPQLIALLSDENTGVQSGASYALRKIGGPQAKQALAQYSR